MTQFCLCFSSLFFNAAWSVNRQNIACLYTYHDRDYTVSNKCHISIMTRILFTAFTHLKDVDLVQCNRVGISAETSWSQFSAFRNGSSSNESILWVLAAS